jgi:hypothetical protein
MALWLDHENVQLSGYEGGLRKPLRSERAVVGADLANPSRVESSRVDRSRTEPSLAEPGRARLWTDLQPRLVH